TVDNPDITIDELIEYVKAPDFPTGGTIYGYAGVKEALHTGRGKVIVRGKANIESGPGGKETIIITEIPYQVNKAGLVAKIAELVNDDKIDGISDLRDESDRNGLRIVVEVKRDAMASVVLSKLYKFTPLQTSYGVNNIALVNGRPKVLNLKDLITEFIKFRIEVIIRRTQYDLEKALERAHILEGILIALDNIDEVIRIIRQSKTVDEAKDGLMTSFALSEIQAKAILEMRLQRLVSLEIDKVREEYAEVLAKIEYYRSILASDQLQRDIIKQELDEINEKFGDKRRTDISYADDEISIEDLIPNEEVVITISHLGYIKRTKTDEFKQQSRGGKGSRGAKTRDTDFVEQMFIAHNHNYLLLFTEQGRCFWLRAFEIPEASKTSQGRVLQNILAIPSDDKVRAYIKIENLNDEEFINNNYIIFCTKKGMVKKTIVEAFSRPRTNGINAITINEGDQLLEAKLTNGTNEIIIANKAGRAIRFNEAKARPMGRGAAGVKAITLTDKNDEVVGMIAADPTKADFSIFVVSEKGNGKRSPLEDYRITNRGGKGVKTINITDKTGKLIAIKWVSEFDDLMITTVDGIIIRTPVSDIRLMGRATQGVKVIRINDKESIADVTVIRREEAIDEEE
ncbi:MAG: DNA gyrase subunit A, partial [Saprospiraceae bacterium]|nr:DNA gyrase subunit A [Saprospiraceae bacterium]